MLVMKYWQCQKMNNKPHPLHFPAVLLTIILCAFPVISFYSSLSQCPWLLHSLFAWTLSGPNIHLITLLVLNTACLNFINFSCLLILLHVNWVIDFLRHKVTVISHITPGKCYNSITVGTTTSNPLLTVTVPFLIQCYVISVVEPLPLNKLRRKYRLVKSAFPFIIIRV
jgi:hypothetical protein